MFRILEINTFVGKVYSIEMYNHQYESDSIRFKGVLDGRKTEIVGKDIFNYEVVGATPIKGGMFYAVWTDIMLDLADVIDFTSDTDVSESFYLDKYAQLILDDAVHIRNVGDQHKLQHSVCQILIDKLGSSAKPEWYESFYVACGDKIYNYRVNDINKFMAIAAKTRLLYRDVSRK